MLSARAAAAALSRAAAAAAAGPSRPAAAAAPLSTSCYRGSSTEKSADGPSTHTGQEWTPEDIRNSRYMHRSKEVNPRWAIDLIAQIPPKVVHTRVVHCDGGGGAMGHPRVYINLDSNEPVSCPYCGLRYIYQPIAAASKKKEEEASQ